MAVADKIYFTKEHIERCRFNASSTLAEQALHCLELVAELSECGLKYQFKGGNSLLLILNEPKRFSIDVDIASGESRERIEEVLNSLVAKYGVFFKWERRQHKTKPWLPLSSYNIYYSSLFDSSPDTCVMLDVQMRTSPYKTEFKKVCCGSLYKSGASVELPLPSSIIADKLLTLGPSTLGIPVGRGKEAQRLKHVYDVSRISATLPDVNNIRESFVQCLEQENDLQNTSHSVMDIVKDTLSFLWTSAMHENLPPFSGKAVFDENIRGLEPFAKHLFDAGYDWRALQRDMARAALCISAAGNESITNEMLHERIAAVDAPAGFKSDVLKINSPYAGFCWETVYGWWGNKAVWGS
ncbi:MAG: nucleotidyl transferase AbiEii/AbiGii toxin family protein [Chitinispirillales bacterium]|nr:nucleotidyl transferase AbiEii/AbiGii toxin family protein [Chitinispirillales bacterium]